MAAPTQELSPSVAIASDKLSANLTIPPGCDPLLLSEESLLGQIRASGVEVTEFTKQVISDTIKGLPDQDTNISVQIARAQPVVDGVDGRVEWLVSAAEAGDSADSDTSVSHYNQCAFVMVKSGDEVGRVHAPTFGEDGRDVAGETIPAKSGKEAVLLTNESLMKKADGTLVAQDDGVLYREPGKAQIHKKIEIKDYVDFSTGNIDFDGDITIQRGVRDCFVVKATGTVEVNGLIEAATIDAGGDLVALGGFAGRERGFATIGGCLRGKYLDNVHGMVQQDLCIDREVINCELRIDGAIDSPNGSIIGGKVTATGSINIGTLGSGAGAPTEIVIGSVPRLEPFANELTVILEILTADADRLVEEQDLINKLSVKGRMTATDKERQTEIMFELANVNTARGKVQRTLDNLNREIDSRRTLDVTVNKMLNCGAIFILGEQRYKVTGELKGPVTISLDDRKELAYRQGNAPSHPLSQIADVQAIIPPKQAA